MVCGSSLRAYKGGRASVCDQFPLDLPYNLPHFWGQARPIRLTDVVASRAALIISVKLHIRIVSRRLSDMNALSAAHRQQAKAYELHAATSLAQLWDEQSRVTEARDLLTPSTAGGPCARSSPNFYLSADSDD
jgi:hypothetical protein